MLCQFLLHSKMNNLCVYIYSLFCGFPFHLGHHRALSRVPCAIHQVLISYLFDTQCICQNIQYQSPNSYQLLFPPLVFIHLFYVCVYIYALQTGSLVPCVLTYDICFSLPDLLHSVWQDCRPIHISTNDPLSFLFYGWVMFHCKYHIFFIHPWWTFRLLPWPGYYK